MKFALSKSQLSAIESSRLCQTRIVHTLSRLLLKRKLTVDIDRKLSKGHRGVLVPAGMAITKPALWAIVGQARDIRISDAGTRRIIGDIIRSVTDEFTSEVCLKTANLQLAIAGFLRANYPKECERWDTEVIGDAKVTTERVAFHMAESSMFVLDTILAN